MIFLQTVQWGCFFDNVSSIDSPEYQGCLCWKTITQSSLPFRNREISRRIDNES